MNFEIDLVTPLIIVAVIAMLFGYGVNSCTSDYEIKIEKKEEK